MECYNHPGVETGLTCGNCDRPICAKCVVHHFVGIRCRECAKLRRVPTFNVTPVYYARAVLVGLGLAVAGGLALAYMQLVVRDFFLLFYLKLFALAGVGFVIGEGMSLAVNKKRSVGLQVIAGISAFITFALSQIGPASGLYGIIALAAAVILAIRPFRW